MSRYSKAIVALISALGVASSALSNGKLGYAELATIGIAFSGVIAVYKVPNK